MSEKPSYFLAFYVPEDHLEKVLDAVFSAGAGKFRGYDRCAWTTAGDGRFRPVEGSTPFTGRKGEDTRVPEIKVECVVSEADRNAVEKALIEMHPYEEPAYHFLSLHHA
ncbi:MAG: NGG1p interacting factor NIF3 [Candidatus Marinimicrobia bacterium]|nr:NGG1p interacting factor NIF3 [Candidatus Neomarinimicrobiota bacterium]